MKKTVRQIRKEAQLRQKRIRSAVFTVVVISVLGLAGYYLKEAFFRPAPPVNGGERN